MWNTHGQTRSENDRLILVGFCTGMDAECDICVFLSVNKSGKIPAGLIGWGLSSYSLVAQYFW
jgi:hypothetical protein